MARHASTPTTPVAEPRPSAATEPAVTALSDTAEVAALRADSAHPAPAARAKVRTRVPKKPARRTLWNRVIDGITTTKMPPGLGYHGD